MKPSTEVPAKAAAASRPANNDAAARPFCRRHAHAMSERRRNVDRRKHLRMFGTLARPRLLAESTCFPPSRFEATNVRGERTSGPAVEYLRSVNADSKLPLTADYNASVVNVSIQSVDEANGLVKFDTPVFNGVPYKLAAPVGDYVEAFEKLAGADGCPVFSCNCILNYLYSGPEGKKTGSMTGPITFGEIVHILLNQPWSGCSSADRDPN